MLHTISQAYTRKVILFIIAVCLNFFCAYHDALPANQIYLLLKYPNPKGHAACYDRRIARAGVCSSHCSKAKARNKFYLARAFANALLLVI